MIPPSRRKLLERVGYKHVQDSARKHGMTVDEYRQMLHYYEAQTLTDLDGVAHYIFRRGIEMQYQPDGSTPDDCEMVRMVLAQDVDTLINAPGRATPH